MTKYIAALVVVLLALSMLFAQAPLSSNRTYSANFLGLVPATSATDILTITGAPTGLTIISSVTVSCTETTAGVIDIVLLTRSSADTGGTSTTATISGNDSQNSTAGAIVTGYT